MSDNTKRTRKSFEEAKAEQIATLEGKLARAKEHVAKLEAELEKVKNRTPKKRTRPLSEKTKIKKITDMAAQVGKSPADIAKALGLDIPEEWK